MLKILQARLQQYVNWELPHSQAGFRKGRGTRDQIANICWNIEKTRECQKNIYFCFIDYAKAFVWITTSCGKFLKRLEYQNTLRTSWETSMQVKKQQLEPDMEQRTDSRSGKEYVKGVYYHLAYLTYMQSTSCEMDESQAGIKIASRNINNLRYADDTIHMAESKRNWRACWWRWSRRVKKLA